MIGKRITSMLMAILLVMTLLPLGASFVSSDEQTSSFVTTAYAEGGTHPHNTDTGALHCACGAKNSGYCKWSHDYYIGGSTWTVITTVKELKDAFASTENGRYRLGADIGTDSDPLTETLVVSGATNSTNKVLCLNGYTITSSATPIIKVEKGRFWFTDCGNGAGITSTAENGIGVEMSGDEFYLGAKIAGVTDTGVEVKNGTFAMTHENAAISRNKIGVTVANGSKFTMYTGTISGNSGNGVRVNTTQADYAVMSGGTITGNGSDTSGSAGSGVYIGSDGKFTMTGGTISNNIAKFGGGVYVLQKATFTMSGDSAKIIGNTSTNTSSTGGGGVCVEGGTFNMTAGTIGGTSEGEANTAANGGGVYVKNNGTSQPGAFNMSGSAKIIGNTATSNGGGVYVSGGTFTMTGGTIGGTSNGEANTAANGGGVYVGYDSTGKGTFNISGSAKIIGNAASNDGGGVSVDNTCTFSMSGGTISGNTASSSNSYSGGGGVHSKGSFTMSSGTISGNKATGSGSSGIGGGVYASGGTFNMTGGTIGGSGANDGNTANKGSGVYVGIYNTFTMTGGTVAGNKAVNGGGVYVSAGTKEYTGKFKVADGPRIESNTTNSGSSNVYLAKDGDAEAIIEVTAELNENAYIVIDYPTTGLKDRITAAEGVAYQLKDDHILVKGVLCEHANKTTVPAQASTCTEYGWSEYQKCENCDQLFDVSGDQISEVPYLTTLAAHTLGNWQHDTENTKHWKVCSVCDATVDDGPHTVGTAATCTTKAVCGTCGVEFGEKNANNHTGKEEWIQTQETHKKQYECCGAVVVSEASHDWTTSESGVRVCETCGYGCPGHTGGTATCTEAGKCTICGAEYIPALKHDWQITSCTAAKTCSRCNATDAAPGHDYVQNSDSAQHWKECSRCKEIDAENPKAPHTFENNTCTICGYTKSTSTGGYYYAGPTVTAVLNGPDAKSATDYSGGIYGLIFRSTAAFSGFRGVQVDGKTIAAANYTAEDNGGTEIYLKAVYLQTLAAGKHTLTILSAAGDVTAEFTVNGGNNSPKTFDAGVGVYAVSALLSLTGMAWVGKKKI